MGLGSPGHSPALMQGPQSLLSHLQLTQHSRHMASERFLVLLFIFSVHFLELAYNLLTNASENNDKNELLFRFAQGRKKLQQVHLF